MLSDIYQRYSILFVFKIQILRNEANECRDVIYYMFCLFFFKIPAYDQFGDILTSNYCTECDEYDYYFEMLAVVMSCVDMLKANGHVAV